MSFFNLGKGVNGFEMSFANCGKAFHGLKWVMMFLKYV